MIADLKKQFDFPDANDVLERCFEMHLESGYYSVIVIDNTTWCSGPNVRAWSKAINTDFFGSKVYLDLYNQYKNMVEEDHGIDEPNLEARIRALAFLDLGLNRHITNKERQVPLIDFVVTTSPIGMFTIGVLSDSATGGFEVSLHYYEHEKSDTTSTTRVN